MGCTQECFPSWFPAHFRPDLLQLIVVLVLGVKHSLANTLQSCLSSCYFCLPRAGHPTCKLLVALQLPGDPSPPHSKPLLLECILMMPKRRKKRIETYRNSNRRYEVFKKDKSFL